MAEQPEDHQRDDVERRAAGGEDAEDRRQDDGWRQH